MKIFFSSMFKNINIYILLSTLFFSSHCFINDEFKGAKYVKDLDSFADYQETFKNKKFNYGFLLVYSNYCPHCILFSSTYITLSEIFHNELFFYAAGKDHSKYRKDFYIRGYPTILFYNNGSYFEFNQKRSITKLSKFIRKYIPYNCAEITYKNINTVKGEVYNEEDRNIIIGFFNDDIMINSFIDNTNSLKNGYVDLCYYVIRNESSKERADQKFLEMKENEIWTNSRKKGEYKFSYNETDYKETLFENVLNIYEEFNNNNDLNLLERMKGKDFILFIYNDDKMKNEYIEKIEKLYKNEKGKNFFKYYYILYNKNINSEKFKNFETNKIYHVSNDFKNEIIINDLEEILNDNKDNNKKELIKTEKIQSDTIHNSNIGEIIIINKTNSDENENNKITEKLDINNKLSDEKKNTEIVKEVQIDIKEENIPINITKNVINNETQENEVHNFELANKEIMNETKEEKEGNFNHNKFRKKHKFKKENFNKNKILIKKDEKEESKTMPEIIKSSDKDEVQSNDVKKIIIFLVIIALGIYFLITRYLCVGFIKVNDNEIIEFNNQPNTIEVI